MHEFVAEGQWADAPGIRALDIAKRLMDYDFHPPTNYFPLIVHEALMIEPTETENKDTLDAFTEALLKIADEAKTSPELLTRLHIRHPLAAWTRSKLLVNWYCAAGCQKITGRIAKQSDGAYVHSPDQSLAQDPYCHAR